MSRMLPWGLLVSLVVGCGDIVGIPIVRMDEGADTASDSPREEETDSASVEEGRMMEGLNRGLVAVYLGEDGVYVGWRLFGTDPDEVGFDLFRNNQKINDAPITETTDFVDPEGEEGDIYSVQAVLNGSAVSSPETVSVLPAPVISIPLGGEREVQIAGIGDLDGDGAYDLVAKRPLSAVNPASNMHAVSEDTFKMEAYLQDGTYLWRIDLGWNIELGTLYSPMVVYDLDGDGVAEVVTKTAEGTVDGAGVAIGDVNEDGVADYRNDEGRVLEGPELLSVFSGETGEEIARREWIPRGSIEDWGDDYGNRVNHNYLSVAYLDGRRPSLILLRGIVERIEIVALDFIDGELEERWHWSTEEAGEAYYEHVFADIRIADIDGDGRDEVIPGGFALDDDGSPMYVLGEHHGDQLNITDVDPDRPGLESWYCQENPDEYTHPVHLRDADNGALLFGPEADWGKVVSALAGDIDPAYDGMEIWGAEGDLFSARGEIIGANPGPSRFLVFWDGDPLRELLDAMEDELTLAEWMPEEETVFPLGTIGGRFVAHGDLLGDWREEIVVATEEALQIHTTIDPADRRIYTLMHDPTYRGGVALQTSAAYQTTQPGFFIGEGMGTPPRPEIDTPDR